MNLSMFRFLKKQRLAARGMSCGKSRLASRKSMFEKLEEGRLLRFGIVFAAAGILALFCLAGDANDPLRHLLYALLVLALAAAQPVVSNDSALRKNSSLALFLGMILLQVGIGEFLQGESFEGRLDAHLVTLLLPYAFAPLILSVLMGPQIGLSACLVGALWWSVLHGTSDPVVLLLGISGGLVAVLSTLRVRRRSRLLRAGFYSGIAVWILAILSGLIGPILWENLSSTDWWSLGIESAVTVGTGILTAVLVSGSLPVIEKLFGITTEISWLEMADLNHPLLRRLSLEAPGTYHHSLAMANLAEACAEKVGANPTLCRVSAYFHDVGKLVKPEYFTENMPSGENLHDELTPTMSALVILSHVKEGVDLAVRNKLNRRVIDAIKQHHGTTVVEYFYQRACQQEKDARAGGSLMNVRPEDIPKVSEASYRYPGPKPQTLETVIMGLADAAESASRSLERPTPQRLDDLVHDLLKDRIDDGQYDEAPVTVCQLQEIASSLVSSLSSMHHSRIAYGRRRDDKPPVGKD
jgi:putative nucleotidyltransferase with HDIG domain